MQKAKETLELKGKNSKFSPINIYYLRDLIRKRVSYSFWSAIVSKMSKSIPIFEELASNVYNIWGKMDEHRKFSTERQSIFELESLGLCLIEVEDKNERNNYSVIEGCIRQSLNNPIK